LALKEIYRLITVREGDQTIVLPTVQAIMRQLGRIALKGNGPALRIYLTMVQAIDQRVATQAAVKTVNEPQMSDVTDEDRAKAVMALLSKLRLRDQ
jgi:hypothetical protein